MYKSPKWLFYYEDFLWDFIFCKAVKPVSYTSNSSVLAHHKQTGHSISIDGFSTRSTSSSNFELLLRESLLIKKFNPSLNAKITSVPLT